MGENQGALSGITVIDLSRLLPGPFCSMILGDHGARVIAIEDKRFQADDFFVTPVYRNKEHMSLNLKTEQGREIFYRLVAAADVVIEGFRPGVVKRLGVDYEQVRERNPQIVYCSITGYGQTGPFKDKVGHDVNYMAYSGVLDLVGEADRPPSIPGIPFADLAGGSLYAVAGIMMALWHRAKTGMGQYIDISMTDGLVSLLALQLYFKQRTGQFPRRADMMLSQRYACYHTYATKDGRSIAIGALENRFWRQLCACFDVPEYGPLQYDDRRRNEIITFFQEQFKAKTLDEWEVLLADVEACWAPVKTMAEVLEDPLFHQRKMVTRSGRTEEAARWTSSKRSRRTGSLRNVLSGRVLGHRLGMDTRRSLFGEVPGGSWHNRKEHSCPGPGQCDLWPVVGVRALQASCEAHS